MSYYYTYYIGYQGKDGLLYPLGPYDAEGELHPAYVVSRSFTSNLHEKFHKVLTAAASDKLKEEFKFETWDKDYSSLKMLAATALTNKTFLKSGYFLIEDVKKFENNDYDDLSELFNDYITPVVYNNMLTNELLLGTKQKTYLEFIDPEADVVDNELDYEEPHSASDYMFYTYPDYYSEEYESFILGEQLVPYLSKHDISKIVIFLIEG